MGRRSMIRTGCRFRNMVARSCSALGRALVPLQAGDEREVAWVTRWETRLTKMRWRGVDGKFHLHSFSELLKQFCMARDAAALIKATAGMAKRISIIAALDRTSNAAYIGVHI